MYTSFCWENLLFHVIMHQRCTFFGDSWENQPLHVIKHQKCTFWCVIRRPATTRYYASNIHVFAAPWEDLLFHAIIHQIYMYKGFFRHLMRKPTFLRNNASNLQAFWRVMRKLLFHAIKHQIWTFLTRHKKRWRSGAVVRASDFVPRGPCFEHRPVHISLWPWASNIYLA